MSARLRLVVLGVVVIVALVVSVGYVLRARHQADVSTSEAPPPALVDLAAVAAVPHIVFRNTALGDHYGQVSLVPVAAPAGPRAVTTVACERIFATRRTSLCLSADRGLVTTYASTVLDQNFSPVRQLPLTGLPSRARISADGSLAATTTFVFGDSYASPGQFSTRTLVSSIDGASTLDLEQFALTIDGRANTAVDRNLWGVTFVDDDAFYVTAAVGGRTWLTRGSLRGRTLTSIRGDVECPSLSPDGTRIAFKRHGDLPAGRWRLAVYNLATGAETLLAETRSVDDQVVWLDDRQIMYGIERDGSASSDVWVVPADGSGAPRVLVPDASSPAVVAL